MSRCIEYAPPPRHLAIIVIRAKPFDEAGDAILDRRSRSKPGDTGEPLDIGAGSEDVARLHRKIALAGFTSQRRFENADQTPNLNRSAIADVVEGMRSGRRIADPGAAGGWKIDQADERL